MADLQFAVRKLERDFYQEYYLEVWEWVQGADRFADKLSVLYKILSNSGSEWSGGHSATNLEERVKRDVALSIMSTVINQMRYADIKETEAV
jgi:hypothetical protein